jgi:aspartate/methionine/tyrosine aminotransferase
MKEMIGKYSMEYKGGGIYSLAQGVVYWKPPEECSHAMVSALQEDHSDLHMYGPDEGLPELRALLVQKLARENGLDCHDVMITAGANQAYVNCVLTLLGDETAQTIVFTPYYFNHVMALQMTISNDNILCGPTSDNGIPDLEWLQTTLSNPANNNKNIRLVTLTNPGNPTGTYLTREFVQQVVDLCRKHRVWLILDTTYEYFVVKNDHNNTNDQVHFDGCFNEPHVLHIFSFSKSYALAGYRCGYVAVHKQSNIFPQMLKVQDTIPIAPSRIAQIAAIEAVSLAGPAWVTERFATLNSSRTAIVAALSECSKVIMGGNGAMYVMAKLPPTNHLLHDNNDVHVAEILVKDHGVAVIPGSFCGAPGWIRVCYANLPPDTCLQAAQRLQNGLRSIFHNATER